MEKAFTIKTLTAPLAAAALALALAAPLSALEDPRYFSSKAAGTTTADFLNLQVGARAAAMGGAYTAISEEEIGRASCRERV